MSDYFKIFRKTRFYICQSSMPLWIGMHLMPFHLTETVITKNELKKIIQEYPGNTKNCKCKQCRYKRLFDKYNSIEKLNV